MVVTIGNCLTMINCKALYATSFFSPLHFLLLLLLLLLLFISFGLAFQKKAICDLQDFRYTKRKKKKRKKGEKEEKNGKKEEKGKKE